MKMIIYLFIDECLQESVVSPQEEEKCACQSNYDDGSQSFSSSILLWKQSQRTFPAENIGDQRTDHSGMRGREKKQRSH